MKKISLLSLFLLTLLTACKKDEEENTITVKYHVGNRFTYLIDWHYFFDDTTAANADSVSNTTDTLLMEVEKDTVINGINCIAIKYSRVLAVGLRYKVYLEQRAEGIYEIARTSMNDLQEFNVHNTPILIYPSKLDIGMHWGESPDGGNKKKEITGATSMKTSSGNYTCVAIKENFYADDFFSPDDTYIEYVSNQGLMMTVFKTLDTVNFEGNHGYRTYTYKVYRID